MQPTAKDRSMKKKEKPKPASPDVDDRDWGDHDRLMSEVFSRRLGTSFKLQPGSGSSWKDQLVAAKAPTKRPTKPLPAGLGLTRSEWQRVCEGYDAGLEQEREHKDVAKEVPIVIRDIKRFLKLWEKLCPIAKRHLAGEDDVNDLYDGTIHDYRIAARAKELLTFLASPQGRPQAIRHVRAAQVLADLWKARGRRARAGVFIKRRKPRRITNQLSLWSSLLRR